MTNSPILLTLKETAELVGYSRGYIKVLADRSEFPEIVRVGCSDRLYFNARAVRKWIRKRLAANNGKIHRAGGRPLVTRPNSERPTLTGQAERLDAIETRLLTIERYILRTGKRRRVVKRKAAKAAVMVRLDEAPASAAKDLHTLIMSHIIATPRTLSVANAKEVLAHFKVNRYQNLTHEQAVEGMAMVEKMVAEANSMITMMTFGEYIATREPTNDAEGRFASHFHDLVWARDCDRVPSDFHGHEEVKTLLRCYEADAGVFETVRLLWTEYVAARPPKVERKRKAIKRRRRVRVLV